MSRYSQNPYSHIFLTDLKKEEFLDLTCPTFFCYHLANLVLTPKINNSFSEMSGKSAIRYRYFFLK